MPSFLEAARAAGVGASSGSGGSTRAEPLSPPRPRSFVAPQGVNSQAPGRPAAGAAPGAPTAPSGPVTAPDFVTRQTDPRQLIEQYGQYPGSDDERAPNPVVTPGKPSYNPFTGVWGGFQDPRGDSLSEMVERVRSERTPGKPANPELGKASTLEIPAPPPSKGLDLGFEEG